MESEKDYSIIGKTVSRVIRETRYTQGGNVYEAVVCVVFTDGWALLENGEVVPPKPEPSPSVVDRLMAGGRVNLDLFDEHGRLYEGAWEIDGVGIKAEAESEYLNLFPNKLPSHWGTVCGTTIGSSLDLDELRRRVAKREIERLSKWATPVKPKPDMSKGQWWIVKKHGIPELAPDTWYEYKFSSSAGRVGLAYARGSRFTVDGSKLLDGDGDLVTRIKEEN